MSIPPAEPSLVQNEVQILNAMPRKQLTGPDGDNVLRLDIAGLSDHCPVIPTQTLEVWLCLSMSGTPFHKIYLSLVSGGKLIAAALFMTHWLREDQSRC